MSRHTDTSEIFGGFTIDDLISENGVTFEIGELYNEDEDDEEYPYSPLAHFSNEEMLDMLNMNDFDNEEDEEDAEKGTVSLCGMSFAKLRTKMIDLNTGGKVMKFVKRNGIGEVVPHNAQVTIHYIGYFEDRDEPFDSTYVTGKPRTLRLGQGLVILGLEIGISTMQKHEIAVFLIHPDYAYKEFGCPPRIPPNEEVIFVVQLIDYLDNGSADTYQNLCIEEKQSFQHVEESVRHMLVTAKDKFIKHNIKQAIREYKKIVECLEVVKLKDQAEEEEMNKLLTKAYTNLGVCYNKINMPRNACMACKRVPTPTAKSYYNFGKGLLNLAEYVQAMKKLQKAYKLEPHNEDIIRAIQQVNVKERQYLEIEKRLWKNCFKCKEDKTKATEFRKAARDLCENLIDNDDIIRQPLPEGFTEEERQIVREEAAVVGLDVITHLRYGKEIVYLQKHKK